MALYHFSEEPDITVFEPRLLPGGPEREALVWAVGEERQVAYCFPRDCPRILIWATDGTSDGDRDRWFKAGGAEMVAHVEEAWLGRMRATALFRYEFPQETFEPLAGDPWMSVSRATVEPLSVEPVGDLLEALARENVDLRVMESLTPLRGVWETTVHASGIRLRNAVGWG